MMYDALRMLNDEIEIRANYPVDDDNMPVSHASPNKADLECFYQSFQNICEVTLDSSRTQWIREGQPVMRHLRDFENRVGFENTLCLFIAPRVHQDTFSQFWISVKYEYDGKTQNIVPIDIEQFAKILSKLHRTIMAGETLNHESIFHLYKQIIEIKETLNSFSGWKNAISEVIQEWSEGNQVYRT